MWMWGGVGVGVGLQVRANLLAFTCSLAPPTGGHREVGKGDTEHTALWPAAGDFKKRVL